MTSTELANDLSKCSIKEDEKPQVDGSFVVPSTQFPVQVPSQNIQGMLFKVNLDVASFFMCRDPYYVTFTCYKISLIGHKCEP